MNPRGRHSLAPRITLFYFLDIITAMSGIMILISLYFATCLQEGSPLFPGPARWQSAEAERQLQSTFLDFIREKNRQADLRERLRWAELTPMEIRRKLRRLQWSGPGAPGHDEEPRPLQKVLEQLGLASLENKIHSLETEVASRRLEVEKARRTHNQFDQQVRLAQESVANRLAEKNGVRLVADGRDTTKVPVVVEVSYARIVIYPFDQPGARETLERGSDSLRQLKRRFAAFTPDTHYAFLLVQPSGYGVFADLRNELARLGFEVGYDGVPEDPRYLMPDVPTAKPSEGQRKSAMGEPEPWPVEAGPSP